MLINVLGISCNPVQKDCKNYYVNILTGCDKKYWDVQDSNNPFGIYGCYRFDIDGSCYYFKYNKEGKRVFFIDDDIRGGANWWNIISNDTIEFQAAFPYRVLYFSKDTIKLRPILAKRVMMLTVSKIQTDHLKFDTIKNNKREFMYFDKSRVHYPH